MNKVNRLLRAEGGFTLSEMLVTIILMLVVMSALYSIFDMSLRVFSFGNDKVEAVENARIGLERMEREIRYAYPYNKAGIGGSASNTVIAGGVANPSNTITFGNDLNGDRKIDTATEQITYSLSGGSPPALLRNGQAAIEYVKNDGLTFQYLDKNGSVTATPSQVAIVRISLGIEVEGGAQDGTQTLTTDVALRNRES